MAKAYGVRKVVMFDVEKTRTDFAVQYGAHAGIIPPRREEGQDPLEFAQEYAKQIIAESDVGSGFDITGRRSRAASIWSTVALIRHPVEASGAEVCAQMAICMLKNGGTCKYLGPKQH